MTRATTKVQGERPDAQKRLLPRLSQEKLVRGRGGKTSADIGTVTQKSRREKRGTKRVQHRNARGSQTAVVVVLHKTSNKSRTHAVLLRASGTYSSIHTRPAITCSW